MLRCTVSEQLQRLVRGAHELPEPRCKRMALAHAIGDDVEAAYRRGDLFDKRRKLMVAWTSYLSTPEVGKVVPIGKKRQRRFSTVGGQVRPPHSRSVAASRPCSYPRRPPQQDPESGKEKETAARAALGSKSTDAAALARLFKRLTGRKPRRTRLRRGRLGLTKIFLGNNL